MNNKNIFKDKKLRYGTFSVFAVVFVMTILVVINLLFSQFNLKMDFSEGKKFSISQDSIDILNEVNEPIKIYALYQTGSEIKDFTEILDQYTAYSKHITVEYKDPYLYPQFVEAYAASGSTVGPNSVIVESEKRYKVIAASDMVQYTYNEQTYASELASIEIEPQVTNAIKFVTEDTIAVAYTVTGHDETPLSDTFKKQLSYANFEFKELNLFLADSIPEDCNVLIVTTPAKDWMPNEAEMVREYLEKQGSAMFFVDYVTNNLDNLESVLNSYGIQLGDAMIAEGVSRNIFYGVPFYIVPENQPHDILANLNEKGYRTLMPRARSLEVMDVRRNSLSFEPLLKTSKEAYGKVNPESQSVNKEAGDTEGPFTLAYAITDSYYSGTQKTTKIVVVGSSYMLQDETNQYIGGNNSDFFVNTARWLYDKSTSVYIMGKSQTGTSLVMTVAQGNLIAFVCVLVIPITIFAIGLVVWLRRRNK